MKERKDGFKVVGLSNQKNGVAIYRHRRNWDEQAEREVGLLGVRFWVSEVGGAQQSAQ